MPVSFLTDEQERRYERYVGEPSSEQLARFFHLDDADRDLIDRRRSDHMRLGFAVQLCTVRFLGTFLEDPTEAPLGAVGVLAKQLGIPNTGELARYAASERRHDHTVEIRERYGYRPFADAAMRWRLLRWLYALCWTGIDRPSVLFDQAMSWLVTHKVLLPGVSVLERSIARVRFRANSRLWRLLAARITPDQKARLEALLVVPEGGRQSPMDRLRSAPTLQSTNELVRAIERLDEVRQFAAGLPPTDRLPKTRVLALARFAGAAKAQAVARLPDERRAATLLAFLRALEASAQDDVLDLFDLLVTRMFVEAVRKGREARLRGLRDLDAAALTLSKVCTLVLDGTIETSDLRTAVFTVVPQAALEAAVAQVDSLTRPPDDPYFDELLAQHRRIRRFLPHFVRVVGLSAIPAGQPVLNALHHLRKVEDDGVRGKTWPTEFVPKSWERRVTRDGVVDRRAWTLCLVDRLRGALRRRDIFAVPSLRFADPRIGLLDGTAWEAVRPTVCRTLGKSQNAAEEIDRLSERLDHLRQTGRAQGQARHHRRALGRFVASGRLAQAGPRAGWRLDADAPDQRAADPAGPSLGRTQPDCQNALPAGLHRRRSLSPPHSESAQSRRRAPPTRPRGLPRQAGRIASALPGRPRRPAQRPRPRGQRHHPVEHHLHGRRA